MVFGTSILVSDRASRIVWPIFLFQISGINKRGKSRTQYFYFGFLQRIIILTLKSICC